MKTELDIIKDISIKFEKLGIPYMLTGSIAMNYYAIPRMTRDIDVVIEISREDVDKFVSEFDTEFSVSKSAIEEALKYETMFNVIHLESVIKVDCIVRKEGEYRHLEFTRRQKVELKNFSIYIVSKEDLIISKLFWAKDSHSEMQLRDVANLLNTGYDSDYLNAWVNKLQLDSLFREVRHGGY